jgi:hypothetical protein
MMKLRVAFLSLVLVGATMGAEPAAAQSSGVASPDTIVFPSARGTVVFTHGKHADEASCTACHHESKPEQPSDDPYLKCSACHTVQVVEPMRTSLRNAYHDTVKREGVCYSCHKEEAARGKTMPMACADCHKRTNGQPAEPGGRR